MHLGPGREFGQRGQREIVGPGKRDAGQRIEGGLGIDLASRFGFCGGIGLLSPSFGIRDRAVGNQILKRLRGGAVLRSQRRGGEGQRTGQQYRSETQPARVRPRGDSPQVRSPYPAVR